MNKILSAGILCALGWLLCIFLVQAACRADEFRPVTEGRKLRFPEDHGAHPEYETEWWYFTGHLFTEKKRSFGFELTFFRIGVDPDSASPSAWAARSLYLAHFTVTDDDEGKFHQDERLSRGSFDEAGAAEGKLRVWIGDWKVEESDGRLSLAASTADAGLTLALVSKKEPVLHGEHGFSKKGPGLGEASYYYSLSRLAGTGELRIGTQQYRITDAGAWMDREFTSSKLAHGTKGWDWFALQLDNGEELMVYQLRNDDGTVSAYSSGTLVRSDGTTQALKASDFGIAVQGRWQSPETGIRYPAGWELRVPKLGYRFQLLPTVAGQEVQSPASTGVTYWEGRVRVKGVPAGGNAYVELVGYKP